MWGAERALGSGGCPTLVRVPTPLGRLVWDSIWKAGGAWVWQAPHILGDRTGFQGPQGRTPSGTEDLIAGKVAEMPS